MASTDYTAYGKNYFVRMYKTLVNAAGDEVTVYTDIQTAAIFEVMKAILDSQKTEEQTISHKSEVNLC